MGLSTARVAGVRHVLNGTNVDPEGESQGIPGDWIAELYGSVTNYADLPSSGNWQGRRRWVTALGIEFMWSGSAWIPVGGNLPYAAVALGGQTWTGTGVVEPDRSPIVQSHSGVLTADRRFVAIIPGVYEIGCIIRRSTGQETWITLGAGSGWERVASSVSAGSFQAVELRRLTQGQEARFGVEKPGTGSITVYSSGGQKAWMRYVGP